jgi:putative transposase
MPPGARAEIVQPNHVWSTDVTYIPMVCSFLYLVAIIDWASRTFWHGGCRMRASVRRRWRRRKAADIQYRQGFTFTAEAFAAKLAATDVAISTGGRAALWTTS